MDFSNKFKVVLARLVSVGIVFAVIIASFLDSNWLTYLLPLAVVVLYSSGIMVFNLVTAQPPSPAVNNRN